MSPSAGRASKRPTVEGTVVEVWGDPPAHVRVRLHLGDEDGDEPVILLDPSILTAA